MRTHLPPRFRLPSSFFPPCSLLALLLAVSNLSCGRHDKPPADPLKTAFAETGLSAQATAGRMIFVTRCAPCHGAEGRGDGQNAYNLDPPPPDFSVSLAKLPAATVRAIIVRGTAAVGRSPLCPPRGKALTEREVDNLQAFLDALGRGWTQGDRGDGRP